MIAVVPQDEMQLLEDRLARGLDLLFDMEQRGQMAGEYERYLRFWLELLGRYEAIQSA